MNADDRAFELLLQHHAEHASRRRLSGGVSSILMLTGPSCFVGR
jgi:hypothetical protein